MSMARHTVTLAGFELRGVVRTRWLAVAAGIFGAAAVATSIVGLRSFASLGLAGAGAATDGLLQITLLLPPLVGLLLGAGVLARDRERGLLAMLAAQPVRRAVLPLAGFVGATLAVWVVIALGLGVGTLVLSTSASVGDLVALVQVLAIGFAVASASVALGVMLASVATTHQQATTAAAALWLLLALGLDLLLAGAAPGLRLGPAGLLAAVIVNPLEAARVLGLLVIEGAAALGPFGSYLMATLGRSGAIGMLGGVLVGWTAVPLAVAGVVTSRRDA
jgi:ABC-type transport system involved in multi-copper enzyme maturation permease subunit